MIFGILSIKYFITNGDLHFYGTFPNVYKSILTVSTNVIRSSGLSRTAMLIYIPLFIYLLLTPVSKKKFFFNFILVFLILLTQSRLTNIFWFIFLIFSGIWFLRYYKFLFLLKKFLILIILPFLITGGVVSSKYYLILNEILITNDKNIIIGMKIFDKKNIFLNKERSFIQETSNNDEDEDQTKVNLSNVIRIVDPSTFSSGRVNYWKQIIDKNEKYLIGNGFLGDRLIIENNASNIIFYSYASSGIFGLILITILILRSFFICIDLMFVKKISFKKKNIITITSIFYLAFLTFRGIGENSYAIFSIDQIIFLQSLFIVETYRNKLSKNE